jgi:hypothetical protein
MTTALVWLTWCMLSAIYTNTLPKAENPIAALIRGVIALSVSVASAVIATIVVNR